MIASHATFRVAGYAIVVIVALAGALASGRPVAAVLAAPFATHLARGLLERRPAVPRVRVSVETERMIEGEDTWIALDVQPPEAEVVVDAPRGVSVEEVVPTSGGLRVRLSVAEWGVYDVGHVAVRAFDVSRNWMVAARLHAPVKLRVYPHAERLPREVVAARELQPFVGHHPSRARADGFEFADVRPYRIGDRARAVNWRASARREGLWVNERHPDRTTTVVVMLDTFGAERAARQATLDLAVRTVASLTEAYGRTQDRIGLLTFGGHLRWVDPSGGRRQVLRIVDVLLDTDALMTETWAGVPRVPVGAIPPRSLLLAVSPLDNDTATSTLADLRHRGFDVAVLAVRPASTTPHARSEAAALGARLDELLRGTRRARLERLGIVVADAERSLTAAVREVDQRRRRLQRVRL